ncbi:MAG: isoleucine--tRNA ligase [Rhodospirillaceae bacterium TMED8]|nr:isoleucine--tRNA ligase [Magnetovibrio sp.]OUT47750.1 MAG: isoleucine--tRNA ligase [Rhodospirillaceae bacterium TMED8]
MSADYKSTVYLPKTDFPMKAGLPRREPELLKHWERTELFRHHREFAKGREKFILHDGPPYANGHLHIGHALNKILKDVIVRSQQMLGKDAHYVPGWDCHGLPIEWKIEERYRKKKQNKDDVPLANFRQECREFAQDWIDIQREEFKRLGIIGEWENPYLTMSYSAEARIAAELGKFLMNGALYKGAKPVMWSPVERTALAEAEIEYFDHTSTTIFVAFPIKKTKIEALIGAAIVIWTTTPWTMPGNRAVAYGEEIDYVLIEVISASYESQIGSGQRLIVAEARLESFAAECGVVGHAVLKRFKGTDLDGTLCHHPFNGQGFDFDVPAISADFATTDEGTGIVHIAPGHGADDWILGVANGIEVPETVGEDGKFYDHVPLVAGWHVYKCNDDVAKLLQQVGALVGKGTIVHRYPHSWRSKQPLIFRNTAQWFISMEKNNLRKTALKAIDETRFVPQSGQKRLRGMIESRPDWCVSRQRAWGVPITVFVNKKTGEPLRDQAVLDRVIAAFAVEGADAWFSSDPQRFLGSDFKSEDFEQVKDILDVWFDSGSTHAFVLEDRPELEWPASLYLEGSDQHRGWFHSSLLESCGTRGRAPYEAVLTHGFVMAEDGQKMSKSLGNTIEPQNVYNQQGADILRLWVVGSDFSEDLRIGPEILKQQTDVYRRLRNTLRFILGNLTDFSDEERLALAEMPELERWVLHRIREMDQRVRQACDDFEFHALFSELHNFCTLDLSAFYLDIRKDSLYCDRLDSNKRRAARTVLDTLFDCLTAWMAPFICFTAEEAWLTRHPDLSPGNSVHLRLFPQIPEDWRNDALAEKWEKIREVRRVVTAALERKRGQKSIGSSLQAAPVIYVDVDRARVLTKVDMAEICIVSGVSIKEFAEHSTHDDYFILEPEVSGVAVGFEAALGKKCERCFQVLEEVGTDIKHPNVCLRCADAADHFVSLVNNK